jgi:hypothetical protein
MHHERDQVVNAVAIRTVFGLSTIKQFYWYKSNLDYQIFLLNTVLKSLSSNGNTTR